MALQSESTQSPHEQNSHLQADILCCLMLISSAITWTKSQKVPTVRDWISCMSRNILGCLANACLVGGADQLLQRRDSEMLHPQPRANIPAPAELFINHTPWAVLTQPLSSQVTRSPTLGGKSGGLRRPWGLKAPMRDLLVRTLPSPGVSILPTLEP